MALLVVASCFTSSFLSVHLRLLDLVVFALRPFLFNLQRLCDNGFWRSLSVGWLRNFANEDLIARATRV
jgi:hypothetical protein